MKLSPVFKDYLWGGHRLHDELGKDCGTGITAESWELSTHPDGFCRIASGTAAGETLAAWLADHPAVLGTRAGGRTDMPILIKLIDAAQNLSVQVHPDDDYARRVESDAGKTEMWYILDAAEGAEVICGVAEELSREELAAKAADGSIVSALRHVPVRRGDALLVRAGTLHGIGAGVLICEIQQSSNVTYRVYDYDRVQADGTKRELHLQKSLDVIDFGAKPITSGRVSAPTTNGITQLVCCPRYTVWHVRATGTATLSSPKTFYCASVIEGTGRASDHELRKGDHFIVPAGYGTLRFEGDMQLIVSTVPANDQAA